MGRRNFNETEIRSMLNLLFVSLKRAQVGSWLAFGTGVRTHQIQSGELKRTRSNRSPEKLQALLQTYTHEGLLTWSFDQKYLTKNSMTPSVSNVLGREGL